MTRRQVTARVAIWLAAVALVVVGWLEVGWFVTDRADVVCVGQEDGSMPCTAIRYYRYRTQRHVAEGVIGVTVVELENSDPEGGGPSYELRFLQRGGWDGASLDRSHSNRAEANREASRLAALIDAAPGERITERTIEPLSTMLVVVLSLLMALLTVVAPVCAVISVGLMAFLLGELWGWVRRGLPRLRWR